MKKVLVIAAIILALLAIWYYWRNPLSARVKIRDQVFLVDLAITPPEREKGLSGRASLAQNRGMLFVYEEAGLYHFWMRGMRFPLDFIWIADNTIVDLTLNVPAPKAGEAPAEQAPKAPVDKVLEVNAGEVAKWGISIGDRVEFLQ